MPDPTSWHIRVSGSVLSLVPNEVLRPWLALESFCRDKAECWPSNKALTAPMGVGSIRVVQAQLERLEDHGICQRRQTGGNRRILVLVRRVAAELTAAEWAAMAAGATRRSEGRAAVAELKKVKRAAAKPKLKIVS